jgi:hypothetical protein
MKKRSEKAHQFFLSRIGLENALDADFERLLERGGLLKLKLGRQHYVSAASFVDSSGNDMWSVNVVAGDDDGTFVEDELPFERYKEEDKK